MTRRTGTKNVLALLLAVLLLAACESDEEKAERYFQSGLALLQAGDRDRALVELRNVFKHNGFHREARETFAEILMDQGKTPQAMRQYLRLVEQYPDALEPRHILAETAIFSGDWDEAMRHANAASALAPDHRRSRALQIVLGYRAAILDREEQRRADIAQNALDMLDAGSGNALLTLTVVDHLTKSGKADKAMPYIDAALQHDPDQYDLHLRKFRLLSDSGDTQATGNQLRLMARHYPNDSNIGDLLIAWYISQNDLDGAEAYLRARVQAEGAGTADQATLVQFLLDQRGPDEALAELDRIITASDDSATRATFHRLSARVDLERGRSDAAKDRLLSLISDDGYAPHEKAPAQVLLAQVFDREGNRDKARELVEDVLEQSPTDAAALKLRATWAIDASDVDAAIVDLRTALSQSPRDPEALSLMALAHERQGDVELAGERLALAVEVSNEAPAQALRYAAFMVDRGRLKVASTILRSAATKHPGNLRLLSALAEIYLQQQDWSRAQDIAQDLRKLETAEATRVAHYLQAAILTGQNRIEESLTLLQNQFAASSGDAETFRAAVLIVQNMLQSDRLEGALTFTRQQIAAFPDNLELRLLEGNLLALQGDMQAAENAYRSLIAQAPQSEVPVRLLLTVLFATDRQDEARKLLDDSLARMPDSIELNWAKATMLERDGDLAGAAGIYRAIYERDTSNVIAANNYASLLVTQADDAETVDRAFGIARRLKDKNVPQFQDTYGWLLHLKGESAEALPHLQTALAGLPGDPLVNYHIGAVYAALGRADQAREHLAEAVHLYDGSVTKPAQDARALLDSLS